LHSALPIKKPAESVNGLPCEAVASRLLHSRISYDPLGFQDFQNHAAQTGGLVEQLLAAIRRKSPHVYPVAPSLTPSLHPTVLVTLQKAHVQQAKRDPVRQRRIKETLKTLLSKFNETDLKEKLEEVEEREK
jgi:hypothetical protein